MSLPFHSRLLHRADLAKPSIKAYRDWLLPVWLWFLSQQGRGFYFLFSIQNGYGPQPMGKGGGGGAFALVHSDRGVNLTTHLYPVPYLRMRGVLPLFPIDPNGLLLD
jgi:hypothetical protein